jgi:adenylate kinase
MNVNMVGYILLGSPGAGKGTIGQFLQETYGIDHFSSGDLLRSEVSEQTLIGKEIAATIDRGEQVPDEMITQLVLNRIEQLVAENKSFILDGFPQTLPQAERLNHFAKFEIKYIYVKVAPETALERMIHRITCSVCTAIFSKMSQAEEACAKCNGTLVVRKSDQPETASRRLVQFQQTTKHVIKEIKKDFNPIIIDGNQAIEAIRENLLRSLNTASFKEKLHDSSL